MKFKHIMLVGLAALALTGCNRVSPGTVGVQVTNWALFTPAGVDPTPKPVGTYFTGLGTDIYEYPVSTQTHVWTKSNTEGSTQNDEFSFNDSNGMMATADVAISYHIDPTKAPFLYQHYRLDSDGLIDGPIRNNVRNYLNRNASAYSIEEIYGAKKTELITKTQTDVQKVLDPLGIIVEQVYWAGGPRIPQQITDQINKKMANEQAAQAAQASVATSTAEAESKVAKAKGDAQATQIEGEAIRANPQILQQQWIQKWDGKLPEYVSGPDNKLLLNLPAKN